jgi:hypothetical protein
LNALPSFEVNVFVVNVPDWRIKCLVAASFVVINIFSNDSPVFDVERFFSKDLIGMKKSIENKSVELLADDTGVIDAFVRTYVLCLLGLFAIYVSRSVVAAL